MSIVSKKPTLSFSPGALMSLIKSSFVSLACLMVVVAPLALMLPLPETTCPPSGPACASGLKSKSDAAVTLRAAAVKLPDCLPRPRVVSDTAIHACRAWLQIRR